MATWKKLVVSGSNVSQLKNDAGYLTTASSLSAFSTASFDGTDLLANSSGGKLTFASASAAGLTIVADAAADSESKVQKLKRENRRQHDALKDLKQLNASLRTEVAQQADARAAAESLTARHRARIAELQQDMQRSKAAVQAAKAEAAAATSAAHSAAATARTT